MAIIVEFVGGFRDGARFSSVSEDPDEANFAIGMYQMSQQGMIGRKHKAISDSAHEMIRAHGLEGAMKRGVQMNHVYKVADRIEKDGDTMVRFEYVGQEE